MKVVHYTTEVAKALKRHANVSARIREKIRQYADNPAAQANNVAALVDSPYKRLRIRNFRVILEETDHEIIVTKIGPRGSIYE